MSALLRVWFYMKSSKYDKMGYDSIVAAANEHQCVCTRLHLDGDNAATSLRECDVLVLKVTDDIVDGQHCNNERAASRFGRLTQLLVDAPHVTVLDAIETQFLVLSRAELYASLNRVASLSQLQSCLVQPRFAVLEPNNTTPIRWLLAGMEYPLVAKTDLACGTTESHLMLIARCEADLVAWLAERASVRIVVQEFVSHAATVYKCFAIGELLGVRARPSIDVPTEALAFDSQLAMPGTKDKYSTPSVVAGQSKDVERVAGLVRAALADLFGFSVFGFDLLAVDGAEGKFALVDVNYFPGFKEMVDDGSFPRVILEHAKRAHATDAQRRETLTTKLTQ